MQGRVLIIDDDKSMCEMLEADLRMRGFDVTWRVDSGEAFELLKTESFDTVLSDLNMPGLGGIELCDRIVRDWPDLPVLVITAFGSLETAVAAIRAGAFDFVTKPFELDVLALAVERAMKNRNLRLEVKRLSDSLANMQGYGLLVGQSPAMCALFDRLTRIGDTNTTVLVTGESGTGKELVAKAIHKQSRRNEGPFVPVNCAALPHQLLESELFGHTRGAFTDAHSARQGLFVQAHDGTLFLDEIAEMPLETQPKLLRALEEQTVRPVGSDLEKRVDVRIITATNRDLEESVADGRFREDLYYRINVVRIELPPLRARGTDILLLAQSFLEQFASQFQKSVHGISQPVAKKLLTYAWPGNVRELRNAMEHAVALTQFEQITLEDLPQRVREYQSNQMVVAGDNPDELITLDEVERRYIQQVLSSVSGNKTLAARILGLDRKTLYRKLASIDSDETT